MGFAFFNLSNGEYFVLIIILAVTYFVYHKIIRKDPRVKQFIDKFEGPPTIPFFGNAHSLITFNNEDLVYKVAFPWFEKYGRIFRIWLANKAYVLIADAKEVEKVLASSIHIDKAEDYSILYSWLGRGLLTANGAKWQARRKLLTPTFHFKILDEFFNVFNEQSKTLVEVLRNESKGQKYFDTWPILARCTLDIICETAMGKKINAQLQRDSVYVDAVNGMSDIVIKRGMQPWLRLELIWQLSLYGWKEKKYLKVLHGFTEKVIKEKKEEHRKENQRGKEIKRRRAFLDLLIGVSEDGKNLNDLEIREETDTFMFEGHDTTTANLNLTLFLLSHYPDCQKKVQKEIDNLFEKKNGKNVELNSSDLIELKYLEACIKEALRLYPSVPFFLREIYKDCDLGDGKILPSGSVVFIATAYLHRHEVHFPEPNIFNPERFLQEESSKRSPFAFIPFSAGPRNCIGQKFALYEEKVILAHVLRNFSVETNLPENDLVILPNLIIRSKNGMPLKFTSRNK